MILSCTQQDNSLDRLVWCSGVICVHMRPFFSHLTLHLLCRADEAELRGSRPEQLAGGALGRRRGVHRHAARQ